MIPPGDENKWFKFLAKVFVSVMEALFDVFLG